MAEFPSLILDSPYENFPCTTGLLDCDAILTSVVSSISKISPLQFTNMLLKIFSFLRDLLTAYRDIFLNASKSFHFVSGSSD
jgi:hypothetical protein